MNGRRSDKGGGQIMSYPIFSKIKMLQCFFFFLVFASFSSYVKGSDIRIGRTSMKIGSGASIVIKNNTSVSSDAIFYNNGDVYFKNSGGASITANTILNGEGKYHFNGNSDCSIEGEGAISTLFLESGKTLWVNSDFSIVNTLSLESGKINIADNASLRILNESTDAVSCQSDYGNNNFIEGMLYWNVVPGASYVFPVGAYSKGYHPMIVDDVSSFGYIGVKYLGQFSGNWNSSDIGDVKVIDDIGGWQVNTDAEGVTFTPMLSLYTPIGVVNGNFNIFYTPNINVPSNDFLLDYNSKIDASKLFLTTETKGKAGIFAINENAKIENNDSETKELVNTIVANGEGRTTFQVPGISNYERVMIYVYNRFGILVYKNEYYKNDFETGNFRPGTYYYELVLVSKDGEKVLKRDFIEILRRN